MIDVTENTIMVGVCPTCATTCQVIDGKYVDKPGETLYRPLIPRFATGEVLERLDRMPEAQLLEIVNQVWEPFEGDDEWPSNTAPDRATFTALLRALTDDWPTTGNGTPIMPREVDTPEHIREAQSR